MGFTGVYTAIYDYNPQSGEELELREGDVLCILEKSDIDDWWKAKKMASDPEEEEPTGLIPNNYIEEVYSYSSSSPLQTVIGFAMAVQTRKGTFSLTFCYSANPNPEL